MPVAASSAFFDDGLGDLRGHPPVAGQVADRRPRVVAAVGVGRHRAAPAPQRRKRGPQPTSSTRTSQKRASLKTTSPEQTSPNERRTTGTPRGSLRRRRRPWRRMSPRTVHLRTPADRVRPGSGRRPRRSGRHSRGLDAARPLRGPVSRRSTASTLPLCARVGRGQQRDRLAARPDQGRGDRGLPRRWQLTDHYSARRPRVPGRGAARGARADEA